ncbi:MAG TPA: hypothetical protein VHJ20_21655 [Polyangia bacterium]|nr:hypothetical protein [Polyangia bacterium]
MSFGLAFACPLAARATVTEPNGLQVPIASAPIEISLSQGTTPPSVVTLTALFSGLGEGIDWQKDAMTTPAVFAPGCSLTGTMVDHGGTCHVDFGWYNVDPARKGPPSDAEIYPIIMGSDPLISPWHPGVGEVGPTFTTSNIRTDPNYKGGLIGFAIKANPTDNCRQTHYSEQSLNPTCTNCSTPGPWAAALIWRSTKVPNAYYIGFEDLAMGTTSTGMSDFGSLPDQPYKCDGDFNDMVYFLSGITCEGGGTPCDTGMPGVCGAGLNECAAGTTLKCRQSVTASPEVCDGLDNDCNGMVDDGATCPQGRVCDKGVCVPHCSTSEFPCSTGFACDENGFCVEKACVGKVCAAGTVCHAGVCGGPCDGVTCPTGQACHVGRCVDPCEGVTCATDSVCDGGVCVAMCKCSGCATGKTCQADGHCVDDKCANKTCGATEVCIAGACVDRCKGAVCPRAAACQAGACVDPNTMTSTPPSTDGSTTTPFDAGSTAPPPSGNDAAPGGIDATTPASPVACRCDASGASGGSTVLLAVMIAIAFIRKRRS